MKILSIGAHIGDAKNRVDFFGDYTFIDADIVVINIQSIFKQFEDFIVKDREDRGNWHEIFERYINHRKQEINELLKNKGALLIELPSSFDNEYDSINSNQSFLNTSDLLPIDNLKLKSKKGNYIDFVIQDTKVFLEDFSEDLTYHSIIEGNTGVPLLKIKNTNHIIGAFYKIDKGIVILMPEFNPNTTNFSDYNVDVEHYENTLDSLLSFIRSFQDKKDFKLSDWAKNHAFKFEEAQFEKHKGLLEQFEKLKNEIMFSDKKNYWNKRLKLLFNGTGEPLEGIIFEIFTEMGFNVKKPKLSNQVDLILHNEDEVAVIEIKGVTKSATNTNARQLENWISDYYLDHKKSAKGILIVNTFKDVPLNERVHANFPDQMLKYSIPREHCLMTGLQFLSIYLDFKKGTINKEQIFVILYETTGILDYEINEDISY